MADYHVFQYTGPASQVLKSSSLFFLAGIARSMCPLFSILKYLGSQLSLSLPYILLADRCRTLVSKTDCAVLVQLIMCVTREIACTLFSRINHLISALRCMRLSLSIPLYYETKLVT